MSVGTFLLLCCLCDVFIGFAQATDDESLDASYLLKLGRQFDNPMLQLLGQAFLNTEASLSAQIRARELELLSETAFPGNETFFTYVCNLLECTDWSEWTDCPAALGMFSMITRSRDCGFNNSLCTYPASEARTEAQSKVCENPLVTLRACPTSYDLVDNVYCLRYISSSGSKYGSEQTCRNDGAEIVNINSAEKSQAVHSLLDKNSYTGTIYINGKKKDRYSDWEYTYGGEPAFSNWASGEPSGGSSELCKVEEGSPRKWWDRECDNSYSSVCEIVLS